MKRRRSYDSDSSPLLAVDFSQLAAHHPALAKHVNSTHGFDFKDPEAVRQLTIATLADKFNLSVRLPNDRLCPPVPGRLSYLQFVKSLLPPSYAEPVLVLDIGVGCSCIYPLLGHSSFGWRFLGSDIDPIAVEIAKSNVAANGLEDAIRVHLAADSFPLQTELQPLSGSLGTDPVRLVDAVQAIAGDETLRGPVSQQSPLLLQSDAV